LLVEGALSAESAYQLARKLGVRMPIVEAVRDILAAEKSVDQAISELLKRPAISE
jgi:glycerol-3-phosphate dehydrogenase (NAD(P)+)